MNLYGMNALVCCDKCGAVAVLVPDTRWKSWSEPPNFKPLTNGFVVRRHHCGDCAEYNELLASGLVYGRDPSEAVVYDERVAT